MARTIKTWIQWCCTEIWRECLLTANPHTFIFTFQPTEHQSVFQSMYNTNIAQFCLSGYHLQKTKPWNTRCHRILTYCTTDMPTFLLGRWAPVQRQVCRYAGWRCLLADISGLKGWHISCGVVNSVVVLGAVWQGKVEKNLIVPKFTSIRLQNL